MKPRISQQQTYYFLHQVRVTAISFDKFGGEGSEIVTKFWPKKGKNNSRVKFWQKKGKNKSLEDQWNFEIVLHTWLFNIRDLDLSALCFDLFIKQE